MKKSLSDTEFQKAKEAGIRFYASPEEKKWEYLKEGLARTDQERFLILLNLMKLERIMKRATFHSK